MAIGGERLDIVIFGATGFTGLKCIPYAYKLIKDSGKGLKWGVAGRSEEKLKEVLRKMGSKIGADLSQQQIIVADIKNDKSLLQMAEKAKIIIDCCGPFRTLGEPVVKACVQAGTHYVDISGEPEFMNNILLNYNQAAQDKGVYIVSACGVDSIPNDLGLVFTRDQFNGVLNSAVSYVELFVEGELTSGPLLNYGTWESLVYAIREGARPSEMKKLLFPEKFPFKPTLQTKVMPYRPQVVQGWALPFPGSDRFLMIRSQKYFYENENKRPVQTDVKIMVKSFPSLLGWLSSFTVWFFLALCACGRKLLLDYPHVFTRGYFRKDQDPSEETTENTVFQATFYGEGWNEKLMNVNDEYKCPPNRSIVTRVRSKNPGYGGTCAAVVGSALMIATEKNKMPEKGGVYTPGIAFGKTSLIELLNKNGMTFEVISQKDI